MIKIIDFQQKHVFLAFERGYAPQHFTQMGHSKMTACTKGKEGYIICDSL